ncbi:MAG: hypothetical protein P1P81_03075 [Desulfobulbales bacterium]|nr:hypothetical protein [Desulfobulbales bacterium]
MDNLNNSNDIFRLMKFVPVALIALFLAFHGPFNPDAAYARKSMTTGGRGAAPETGFLLLKIYPASAEVRINNVRREKESRTVLFPGKYLLEASAGGFKPSKQWITILPGEELFLEVELEPLPQLQKTEPLEEDDQDSGIWNLPEISLNKRIDDRKTIVRSARALGRNVGEACAVATTNVVRKHYKGRRPADEEYVKAVARYYCNMISTLPNGLKRVEVIVEFYKE